MLAGMAHAMRHAHQGQQALIVLAGQRELLGQSEWGERAPVERRADRADQPGPAERSTPHHHEIGARLFQASPRIRDIVDVAIGHQWEGAGSTHRGDRPPISRALVELLARPAMDRDHPRPSIDRPTGKLGSIAGSIVPAEAHLDRHRHAGGGNGGLDQRDPDRAGEVFSGVDVVFPVLHGPYGEDGTIQGILEYLEIPYPHSGVLASALAMDKAQAKHVAKAAGIPVAEARVMSRFEIGNEHPIKPPYVVKPVREGSSFGVVIVKADRTHPPQILTSAEWRNGDRVMVERYIYGRELTCGVMGDVALGVTEVVPQGHAFYDYDAKYAAGGSRHVIPAQISPNIYQTIQQLALKAHQAIGCRGVSRSDFRFDDRFSKDGEVIWLEINTQPGMTPTSLVPEMAHAGLSFGEFLRWMVEDASCLR